MKQNSKMPTRAGSLKTSTATVQTQDQGLIQKLIYKEPLKFYKTKDMREHEEKSKMAVKTFLENLNNRPKKNQHSTSQSSIKISEAKVLSSGTRSTLKSAATSSNIKATTRINTTQKTKLSQNNKNKSTKTSLDSNCTTTDVQYKEPLKFYKTKDMREHEEKSKWAVQTFWENLNSRSKKAVQSNESQSSTNASVVSDSSISLSIQLRKETPVRSTEQANEVVTFGKDKTIGRSNTLSTSKALMPTSSQSTVDGITVAFTGSYASSELMEIPAPETPTKVSNKRKHSGDGEISNNKLIKITTPAIRKQEFNLPNKPAPQVNNNTQNVVSSGNSTYNGVKSLVQLCTMTLVSNKHRLYQLGDAPYHLLEPILKFCTDEELRQLEEVNPRLIDEDMELWKRFLQQRLPNKPLPDNPGDYRRIYLSIIDEEREKKKRIIGNFRKAMAEEKAKKEARQVKMLAVAPREPKRKHSGYQKLTPLQKIRREMIREGYVSFPHR